VSTVIDAAPASPVRFYRVRAQ